MWTGESFHQVLVSPKNTLTNGEIAGKFIIVDQQSTSVFSSQVFQQRINTTILDSKPVGDYATDHYGFVGNPRG